MSQTNLISRPVHELARDIAARRLSPVELVEAFLARIEAREPKLQAFVEIYGEDARLTAKGAEQAIRSGHAVGPLHGIPIALKDLVRSKARSRLAAALFGVAAGQVGRPRWRGD